MKIISCITIVVTSVLLTSVVWADRPVRKTPVAAEGNYTIYPDQPKQVIKGIGFEIQSDSINSGNKGMTEATTSVPHDLVPAERERLVREMLTGFRYCRLAGGLYWRGTDAEQKYLKPRWPEQLVELRDMIKAAGIEGVSLEYWSPLPFWKTGHTLIGGQLRCFGKDFANDPDYKGDVDRFLKDFSEACKHDLQTLRDNGIPISFWGLQNEPFASTGYSSCTYSHATYARTFQAVAPVVRAFDPTIRIMADTGFDWKFSYVRPLLSDPKWSSYIDDLVIHHVGSNSNVVLSIPVEPSGKPRFQNEYEYLDGPTSPSRCLNTVQHIMNWFQIGEAPTWFWIHALKPVKNQEASGYSLGFWRPIADADPKDDEKYQGLQPGHWRWNPYNWNAVGGFVKHMPWDSRAVTVTEGKRDPDLRIFAFKRPDGKLTIVLSNRSYATHTFKVATGLEGATFKGYRYTPDNSGEGCLGVEIAPLTGGTITPVVTDLTWEFWVQQ